MLSPPPTTTHLARAAVVLRGTKMIADGEVEAGLAEVDRGFDLYDDLTTPPIFWPQLLQVRAAGRMLAGRIDQALALVAKSESLISRRTADTGPGDHARRSAHGDGPARCRDGGSEATRAPPTRPRRAACVWPSWQAATRLATLHRGTPREQASLQQLRDVYDSFTEGHDTVQLSQLAPSSTHVGVTLSCGMRQLPVR